MSFCPFPFSFSSTLSFIVLFKFRYYFSVIILDGINFISVSIILCLYIYKEITWSGCQGTSSISKDTKRRNGLASVFSGEYLYLPFTPPPSSFPPARWLRVKWWERRCPLIIIMSKYVDIGGIIPFWCFWVYTVEMYLWRLIGSEYSIFEKIRKNYRKGYCREN